MSMSEHIPAEHLDYIADPQLRAHLEITARRECAKALDIIRETYRPSAPIEAIVIAAFAHGAAWAFKTDADLGDVATVEDIANNEQESCPSCGKRYNRQCDDGWHI